MTPKEAPSSLDGNALFEIDQAKVTTHVRERGEHPDLFTRQNQADFNQDFSLKMEHRVGEWLTMHAKSHFQIESREIEDDLFGEATAENYQRRQELGARVKALKGLTFGARYEARSALPQEDDVDILQRERRLFEATARPWKKGQINVGVEKHTATFLESDEMKEDKQVYRMEFRQGIADLPVTAKVGSRLQQKFDPDSEGELLDSTTPQISGSLRWNATKGVNFTVGARGEQTTDRFGQEQRESRHIFAEYKHDLTENFWWKTRVAMSNRTQFASGLVTDETAKTEVRFGPRWEMSETFDANLEVFRSWEQEAAAAAWEPAENRVSFSIRGEF